MLDVIDGCLAILQRAEQLIANAHWLIASGTLEEDEALEVHREIESMTAAVFVLEEAVRRLRQTFGIWPDMARVFPVHATLQ